MIRPCLILFGCLTAGELIVFLTDIKLPSSIIGMLLLTTLLKLKWIQLKLIQKPADFLISNLAFFFVPPGIALMRYFDILKSQFVPIVFSSILSTIIVIAVTGWIHQLIRKFKL